MNESYPPHSRPRTSVSLRSTCQRRTRVCSTRSVYHVQRDDVLVCPVKRRAAKIYPLGVEYRRSTFQRGYTCFFRAKHEALTSVKKSPIRVGISHQPWDCKRRVGYPHRVEPHAVEIRKLTRVYKYTRY